MDDGQTLRSLVRDDAYVVERVLSDGHSGRTEIVTLDGEGPLVRKRIPLGIANASAWAVAMEANEPLLPRIESLYRMPDALVVVYDYVPGDPLSEVVEREGRLSPERAVEVIADVCRAVGALHERGVVHRDITPGNVILSHDGAHLVDLGIARQRVEGRRRDTTTLGTWGFAAPEQYGFAQTDARSDVYALGRLLGYLLTGERPDSEAYERGLADQGRVPQALGDVVRTATAFEPSARYQRAEDLAAAAGNALAGGRFALDDERWTQGEGTVAQWGLREATEAEGDAPVRRMPPDGSRDGAKGSRASSAADDSYEPARDRHEVAAAQGVWATGRYESATPKPASPGGGTRAFSEAPFYQRMAAIICWAIVAFLAVVVLLTAFTAITAGDPPWSVTHYGMGAMSVLACLAIAYEVYCAIIRSGLHAHQEHPLRYLLGNMAIIVVLWFVSLLVCAMALPA